eukprot:gene10137-8039_t
MGAVASCICCSSHGSILLVAAVNGELSVAQQQLQRNPRAALYHSFKDKSSSLIQAAARGHFELLQLILETAVMSAGPEKAKKACIDRPNLKKQTAIMVACKHGHPDCVEYLVTNGADPLIFDERRHNSCLHFAEIRVAQLPCLDEDGLTIVKFIDRHNGWGLTALQIAVFQGSISAVRAILRHGANLESSIIPSKVENSPIRFAVGSNALHIAALVGDLVMVKLLLEAQESYPGLELRSKLDALGLRPQEYAQRARNPVLVHLLDERLPVSLLRQIWMNYSLERSLPPRHQALGALLQKLMLIFNLEIIAIQRNSEALSASALECVDKPQALRKGGKPNKIIDPAAAKQQWIRRQTEVQQLLTTVTRLNAQLQAISHAEDVKPQEPQSTTRSPPHEAVLDFILSTVITPRTISAILHAAKKLTCSSKMQEPSSDGGSSIELPPKDAEAKHGLALMSTALRVFESCMSAATFLANPEALKIMCSPKEEGAAAGGELLPASTLDRPETTQQHQASITQQQQQQEQQQQPAITEQEQQQEQAASTQQQVTEVVSEATGLARTESAASMSASAPCPITAREARLLPSDGAPTLPSSTANGPSERESSLASATTDTVGPLPGTTNTVAPLPATTDTVGPMSATTDTVGPMPATTDTESHLPATTDTVGPMPATTDTVSSLPGLSSNAETQPPASCFGIEPISSAAKASEAPPPLVHAASLSANAAISSLANAASSTVNAAMSSTANAVSSAVNAATISLPLESNNALYCGPSSPNKVTPRPCLNLPVSPRAIPSPSGSPVAGGSNSPTTAASPSTATPDNATPTSPTAATPSVSTCVTLTPMAALLHVGTSTTTTTPDQTPGSPRASAPATSGAAPNRTNSNLFPGVVVPPGVSPEAFCSHWSLNLHTLIAQLQRDISVQRHQRRMQLAAQAATRAAAAATPPEAEPTAGEGGAATTATDTGNSAQTSSPTRRRSIATSARSNTGTLSEVTETGIMDNRECARPSQTYRTRARSRRHAAANTSLTPEALASMTMSTRGEILEREGCLANEFGRQEESNNNTDVGESCAPEHGKGKKGGALASMKLELMVGSTGDEASDEDDKSNWTEEERAVCSICMDMPVAVQVSGCQHGLCVQCAFQLTMKGRELPICPFCRQKIALFEAT